MKDDYYLKTYQIKLLPNVNYNIFITLIPKFICKVLLEGSIDSPFDENTSILDDVFKYIDSTKRLILSKN